MSSVFSVRVTVNVNANAPETPSAVVTSLIEKPFASYDFSVAAPCVNTLNTLPLMFSSGCWVQPAPKSTTSSMSRMTTTVLEVLLMLSTSWTFRVRMLIP